MQTAHGFKRICICICRLMYYCATVLSRLQIIDCRLCSLMVGNTGWLMIGNVSNISRKSRITNKNKYSSILIHHLSNQPIHSLSSFFLSSIKSIKSINQSTAGCLISNHNSIWLKSVDWFTQAKGGVMLHESKGKRERKKKGREGGNGRLAVSTQ